jgi:hypothetical protein
MAKANPKIKQPSSAFSQKAFSWAFDAFWWSTMGLIT